ncbi:MAG: dihydropteroate synthase [Muribaculaceae bacterium]|nr:dihydropteroate synthase [Muribaculaceae bacterium]
MGQFKPFTLNLKGKLTTFDRPAVMGIVNVTPDSFYELSRTPDSESIADRIEKMVSDGADILDIGAYSSRPGAANVSPQEELDRLCRGIETARKIAPAIPISIDTFRASVARNAIEMGADIVNDISGGDLDSEMFDTVADLHVPYVVMHMRGNPATMQSLTDYGERGVTACILDNLGKKINRLALKGVCDIIVDPGFGFAKTLEQNYELMRNLRVFETLKCPILVGVSRKSMLTRLLDIQATDALPATTALNSFALDRGASILRVHDVKEAVQAVKIYTQLTIANTLKTL